MLVKRVSCYTTDWTQSEFFAMEKSSIYLSAHLSLFLCSLLHRSISLCSSGFGSQQALFSLAGGFLNDSDKHLLTHIREILHKEEKPYTLSLQSLFLYTEILRAMVVDRNYKHPLTFQNKYL